jgi:hypothetical protein
MLGKRADAYSWTSWTHVCTSRTSSASAEVVSLHCCAWLRDVHRFRQRGHLGEVHAKVRAHRARRAVCTRVRGVAFEQPLKQLGGGLWMPF